MKYRLTKEKSDEFITGYYWKTGIVKLLGQFIHYHYFWPQTDPSIITMFSEVKG